MLKETFIKLLQNYTDNNNLIKELWFEIKKNIQTKNDTITL